MSNTRNWPVRSAHSMTIGAYHTFRDWYMIPEEIPVFAQPEPKTNYIEVPGMDGSLDYTEALGSIKYKNRKGSFSFLVLDDVSWTVMYSTILAAIHGKYLACVLDDDPLYKYKGRFAVNDWNSLREYSRIVIDYNVEPYKYLISDPSQKAL